ncbi:MAG: DUF5916 domain-containing protein [Candidatus Zixiibacteriota bacterium]
MRAGSSILSVFALSTLLLFCTLAFAETIENNRVIPEVKALRVNPHAPKIDGLLDDPIWNKPELDIIRDFTQRVPDEGKAPSESTHVAIVYDDNAIYFAVWMYDSEPDKIQRQLVRRDRYGEADRVAIRLDPFHDHQTGFGFEINCSGVMIDYTIFNDDHMDEDWDAVWESGVKIQPWGWTCEVKIPYHCLRFPELNEHTWGFDVVRWINRRNESDRWAFTPTKDAGFASNFGHLTGITGIKPARRLEIMPYAVSSLESGPKSIGNSDGKDYFNNTGVDIKYGVTSNLTLDVTVNPDFGQVELDSPVLNLSAFETYYSEKRPFFVEGSSLFNTVYDLFYSRRIGRQPQGGVDDSTYNYSIDRPNATSIISAAKLTGKLANGTSIAFLNAVTANEKQEYNRNILNPDGEVIGTENAFQTIEPKANYSVVRVKQDILKNSSIGIMLTNATQDTYHPSTTGGFDWRLQTNDNNWVFTGQSVFNRNDADNTGFATYCEILKNGGEHWRGEIYGGVKDRYYDLNRMGFSGRNSYRNFGYWIQYKTTQNWWIVRRSWSNFNGYFGWNYDGYNISKGGNYNFQIEFMNYWSWSGGIEMQADEYDDYETRGNGIWEWPQKPTFSFWTDVTTDSRKNIYFSWNPGAGQDREGDWWASYIGAVIRPASNIEVHIGSNYHRTFNATRWVTNDGTRSVFGTLDKDQITPEISCNILFNRNLSLQVSAETLIAGLHYRDFREYKGGKEYIPLDPVADAETLNDLAGLSRNVSSINSTFLLRWEFIPGSTLYLVWTRERYESDKTQDNLDVNRDIKRLFSGGADNVFLVKASYWWNI